MMKILVVNPNTTATMTQKIGAAAKASASRGTQIFATNPSMGPASIEGYYDEAISVVGLLDVMSRSTGYDAAILACFDDTGLDAARCVSEKPVLGIGEAAFHIASLIAGKFSVVTTLSRSIPAIEHNLVRYGLASRCARVRAADVPVLELEREDSDARQRISYEIELAKVQDRAEAIVLGCAGMTDLAANLSAEHDIPVVDGVAAAVKLAEAIASLGLKTSKLGGYAVPSPKLYTGMMSHFAPRPRQSYPNM